MREPVRDRDRLEHILEAIDRILTYTAEHSNEEIAADKIRFYGIVKNIEIVGEASYKLTKAFRDAHPDTPWDEIMKMRHVLVHDYFQIDEDAVFYVIEDDLPPLREHIARYLTDTNWNEWEKNDIVISESASRKSLIQTASRMKADGLSAKQISRYTGLTVEEIDKL